MRESVDIVRLKVIGFTSVLLAVLYSATVLRADTSAFQRGPTLESMETPCGGENVNWIGELVVPMSNFGTVGCLGRACDGKPLASIEFPRGSGQRFGCANLWMGGVIAADTFVSTSLNELDFEIISELRPPACPEGAIAIHTRLPYLVAPQSGPFCEDVFVTPEANADQEFHSTYTDTLVSPVFTLSDPNDGRPHASLGLRVQETAYIWSSANADDFVLVNFRIQNIGRRHPTSDSVQQTAVSALYLGIQGECHAESERSPSGSIGDEIVGFVDVASSPQIPKRQQGFRTAWMADNDGDPESGTFGPGSVQSVLGFSLVDVPTSAKIVSYNWWARDPIRTRDWGPTKVHSGIEFLHGGSGTPLGDRAKYQMLSNGEVDYVQSRAAMDMSAQGWSLPHPDASHAADIADGYTSRWLLSFGPLELPFGSEIQFTLAVCGGEAFHTDPNNFRLNFSPFDPDIYVERLELGALLSAIQRARWTFDNPGVDTDGDGYAGEYLEQDGQRKYYRGDGVPDFRSALPPPSPSMRFESRAKRICLRWNGYSSETDRDIFAQRPDFEGYRVYMSRTGREEEWALLAQRDMVNYARFTWNAPSNRWEFNDPPYSVDSLKTLYDVLSDTAYGFPFHPDSFSSPLVDRALLEILFDPNHPERVDSVYRYFVPYEANNWPDDLGLALAAESGADVTGVIRKLFPTASPGDTAYREDNSPYLPYYEYEYVVKNLQIAEPVFLSVTAFDHGDPASGLEPLESGKSINAKEIWPINAAEVVKSDRLEPGVYPNPYRLIDDYYGNNLENRLGLEPDRERARQVTFYNVPDSCTVSIWSLDGDLVRTIKHYADPGGSEATVVRWDLISRNTQAVKTGVYIWSIESRFGTDVGKLVIIK